MQTAAIFILCGVVPGLLFFLETRKFPLVVLRIIPVSLWAVGLALSASENDWTRATNIYASTVFATTFFFHTLCAFLELVKKNEIYVYQLDFVPGSTWDNVSEEIDDCCFKGLQLDDIEDTTIMSKTVLQVLLNMATILNRFVSIVSSSYVEIQDSMSSLMVATVTMSCIAATLVCVDVLFRAPLQVANNLTYMTKLKNGIVMIKHDMSMFSFISLMFADVATIASWFSDFIAIYYSVFVVVLPTAIACVVAYNVPLKVYNPHLFTRITHLAAFAHPLRNTFELYFWTAVAYTGWTQGNLQPSETFLFAIVFQTFAAAFALFSLVHWFRAYAKPCIKTSNE